MPALFLRIFIILSGITLFVEPAIAGSNVPQANTLPVLTHPRDARGPFHKANLSESTVEYIGCSVIGYSSSDNLRIYCSAKSDYGFLGCFKDNPSEAMLHAVLSLGSASYLEFKKRQGKSECETIKVFNTSVYLLPE